MATKKKEAKTTANEVDVYAFIEAFANNERKKNESRELIEILKEITGEEPRMWGPSNPRYRAIPFSWLFAS